MKQEDQLMNEINAITTHLKNDMKTAMKDKDYALMSRLEAKLETTKFIAEIIDRILKGYKLVKNDRIEWLKLELAKEIEFAKSNPHKAGRSFNQIIDEAFEDAAKTIREKRI